MKRRKILIATFFSLLGVFLVAGYFGFYLRPYSVLNRAIVKTLSLNSSGYQGTLRVEYKKPDLEAQAIQTPITFSVSTIGNWERDSDGLKAEGSYTVTAGTVPVAEFDLRKVKDKVYLYVKSLNMFSFGNNTDFVRSWLEIDLSKIPIYFPEDLVALSTDEKKVLAEKFIINPPILVTEILPEETVAGSKLFRYRYVVQKENLLRIADSDQVSNFLSNVEFGEGEIWINKNTGSIYRIIGKFERKGEERDSPIVIVLFDVSLKNPDLRIDISPPKSSKPVEEFIKEVPLFSSF